MRMLYLLTVLTFLGLLLVVIGNPGQEYWADVGPSWDKMLNPCSYEACNGD